MKKCGFLSLGGEIVGCFEECPFYDLDETEGSCPFEDEISEKKFVMTNNEGGYNIKDEFDRLGSISIK